MTAKVLLRGCLFLSGTLRQQRNPSSLWLGKMKDKAYVPRRAWGRDREQRLPGHWAVVPTQPTQPSNVGDGCRRRAPTLAGGRCLVPSSVARNCSLPHYSCHPPAPPPCISPHPPSPCPPPLLHSSCPTLLHPPLPLLLCVALQIDRARHPLHLTLRPSCPLPSSGWRQTGVVFWPSASETFHKDEACVNVEDSQADCASPCLQSMWGGGWAI